MPTDARTPSRKEEENKAIVDRYVEIKIPASIRKRSLCGALTRRCNIPSLSHRQNGEALRLLLSNLRWARHP
jgi:hypothetical protein